MLFDATQHLSVVTAPTVEPLTLDDAKLHLRQDGDYDDNYIESLITAVREQAEHYLLRQLAPATYDFTIDEFPESRCMLFLPKPPLTSVTSITYRDSNGDSTVMSSSLYEVFANAEPGFVIPKLNESWPTTYDMPRAVTVRYICGYTAATIPKAVKQGMLLAMQDLYDNRGAKPDQAATWAAPLAAQRLWDSHRWAVNL